MNSVPMAKVKGSTTSDFDPQERARGHSIDAAIAAIDHRTADGGRVHVNLVDTPGYPDFRGAALSALSAVDTVAVVVDTATDADLEAFVQEAMPIIETFRFAEH